LLALAGVVELKVFQQLKRKQQKLGNGDSLPVADLIEMQRKYHTELDQPFPVVQLYQQGLQEGDQLQQQRF
jgi:hypothetical protein